MGLLGRFVGGVMKQMMVNSLEHYGVFDELEKQNKVIKNSQPQIIIIKSEEKEGMSALNVKLKKRIL